MLSGFQKSAQSVNFILIATFLVIFHVQTQVLFKFFFYLKRFMEWFHDWYNSTNYSQEYYPTDLKFFAELGRCKQVSI